MPLGDLLRRRGNDYDAVDRAFRDRTQEALTEVVPGAAVPPSWGARFSVIIPSLNGHRTLPVTLAALAEQTYRAFEVILVDDGSDPPLASGAVGWARFDSLRIVRLDRPRGISFARNVGIALAEGDTLLFLDDDIRLPPHVLSTLALRAPHLRECVVVGFRENVSWREFSNGNGVGASLEQDWRCCVTPGRGHFSLTADSSAEVGPERTYRLLDETRDLKEFGNGRVLGYWDLPNMVVGHSVCVDRAVARDVGGFYEGFRGWGTEDLLFGALLVAHGMYVVPAREWVSFHPIQEGRLVSRDEQWRELKENFRRYREYLATREEPDAFPVHPLRTDERREGLEILTLA